MTKCYIQWSLGETFPMPVRYKLELKIRFLFTKTYYLNSFKALFFVSEVQCGQVEYILKIINPTSQILVPAKFLREYPLPNTTNFQQPHLLASFI